MYRKLSSGVSCLLVSQALKGLASRLKEIQAYLVAVIDGKLPVNHDILELLQDIFNLLPNMSVESLSKSLAGVCLCVCVCVRAR